MLPQPPGAFRVALAMVKWCAMAVGILLTVLCLMATVAVFSRDLLVQLIPALLVGVGIPLILAERLLREDRRGLREGLATDVLAVIWFGFALLFVGGGFPVTQSMLLREANIISASSSASVSKLAPLLAWVARGTTGRSIARGFEENESARRLGVNMRVRSQDAGMNKVRAHFDAGLVVNVETESSADGGVASVPLLTARSVAMTVAPSVVTLSIRYEDGQVNSASGVIIDERGTVATAASLLVNAESLAIRLADGRWVEEVWLVARDLQRGLALLVMGVSGAQVAAVARSVDCTVGDELVVVGNPLGLDVTFNEGELLGSEVRTLSQAGREGGSVEQVRMHFSVSVTAATLGGPVLNRQGEVVGIAVGSLQRDTLRPEGSAPVGLGVPIEEIANVERLEEELDFYGRGSNPPVQW